MISKGISNFYLGNILILLFYSILFDCYTQEYSKSDNLLFEIYLQPTAFIYVDDDNNTAPWDGTIENPYQYIEDGVSNALVGETVVVFPGDYQITSDLTILDSISLYLKSGVNVEFGLNAGLEIEGRLQAAGKINDSIVFSSINTGETWKGILFNESNSGSELRFCLIENCAGWDGNKGGAVCVNNSSPTFFSCTFQNNIANYGAAIFCGSLSAPEITGCFITNNIANIAGGGILSHYAFPWICENFIISNQCNGNTGGGGIIIFDAPLDGLNKELTKQTKKAKALNLKSSRSADFLRKRTKTSLQVVPPNPFLKSNPGGLISIENKEPIVKKGKGFKGSVPGKGGALKDDSTQLKVTGIYAMEYGYNPVIQSNTFQNNTSLSDGAGCYIYKAKAIVYDNCFEDNDAENGAAIYIAESDSTIVEWNLFTENTANLNGGAIYVENTIAINIGRNVLTFNAADNGPGLYLNNSNTLTYNNTLFLNVSVNPGGGIYSAGWDNNIFNNIFWNNNSPDSSQVAGTGLNLTYNDIQYGYAGEGNFSAYPLFVDTAYHNYHIQFLSLCVNAGDPWSPDDPDSTRADVGVYYSHRLEPAIEVLPDSLFVTVDSTGSGASNLTISNWGNSPLFFALTSEIDSVAKSSYNGYQPPQNILLELGKYVQELKNMGELNESEKQSSVENQFKKSPDFSELEKMKKEAGLLPFKDPTAPVWVNPGSKGKENNKDNGQENTGMAVAFDGNGDYIRFSNPQLYNLNQFTLEVWVNTNLYLSNGGIITLGNSSHERFSMHFGSNNTFAYSQNWNNGIWGGASSNQSLLDGEWYHLVVTHDSTTVRLYVNGIMKSSTSMLSPTSFSSEYYLETV